MEVDAEVIRRHEEGCRGVCVLTSPAKEWEDCLSPTGDVASSKSLISLPRLSKSSCGSLSVVCEEVQAKLPGPNKIRGWDGEQVNLFPCYSTAVHEKPAYGFLVSAIMHIIHPSLRFAHYTLQGSGIEIRLDGEVARSA